MNLFYETSLAHHGIKGMKWGVRRYQNYDGSYTQRGLKRYRDAEENYAKSQQKVRSAKENYKSGIGSKQKVREARQELWFNKRKLNSAYDNLRTDNLADEGKKLYERGKTITSNNLKFAVSAAAVAFGSDVISKYIYSSVGNLPLAGISRSMIVAGGNAVKSFLGIKTYSENEKLREYYWRKRGF